MAEVACGVSRCSGSPFSPRASSCCRSSDSCGCSSNARAAHFVGSEVSVRPPEPGL